MMFAEAACRQTALMTRFEGTLDTTAGAKSNMQTKKGISAEVEG